MVETKNLPMRQHQQIEEMVREHRIEQKLEKLGHRLINQKREAWHRVLNPPKMTGRRNVGLYYTRDANRKPVPHIANLKQMLDGELDPKPSFPRLGDDEKFKNAFIKFFAMGIHDL